MRNILVVGVNIGHSPDVLCVKAHPLDLQFHSLTHMITWVHTEYKVIWIYIWTNYKRNVKIFFKLRPTVLKYFCSEDILAGSHNTKGLLEG